MTLLIFTNLWRSALGSFVDLDNNILFPLWGSCKDLARISQTLSRILNLRLLKLQVLAKDPCCKDPSQMRGKSERKKRRWSSSCMQVTQISKWRLPVTFFTKSLICSHAQYKDWNVCQKYVKKKPNYKNPCPFLVYFNATKAI